MSALKHVLEVIDPLDDPEVTGESVRRLFAGGGFAGVGVEVKTLRGERGSTDPVTITIPGTGGRSPTLGVVGRLGVVVPNPAQVDTTKRKRGGVAPDLKVVSASPYTQAAEELAAAFGRSRTKT